MTECQQSTDQAQVQVPSSRDPPVVGGLGSAHGGPTTVPSLSARVPIITVDRWAVRPQTRLAANNTAAKPGRYTDVIGPFD